VITDCPSSIGVGLGEAFGFWALATAAAINRIASSDILLKK
jgi:hypothetical protein